MKPINQQVEDIRLQAEASVPITVLLTSLYSVGTVPHDVKSTPNGYNLGVYHH